MADDTSSNDRGSGAATQPGPARRPGLIRSIIHRLAGEQPALPVEGHLASFGGATQWLNSQPLTPEGLRGRVVVVDFWTYTCVNWLRTFPYVRAWAAKYAAAGLTVVGVHTPEFEFEHNIDNVIAQVGTLAVEYPVAVDNDYAVWRAFSNHYWPAVYIADAEGRLRYHHFGEGEYAMSEMVIQQLLLEAGATDVDQELVFVEPRGLEVAADWRRCSHPRPTSATPRAPASPRRAARDSTGRTDYAAAPQLPLNYWDLSGTWTVAQHAALLDEPGGRVAFEFHARDVNLVMGPAPGGKPIPFRVFLDGETAVWAAGTDVAADGHGTVTDQRCYQLIRQPGPIAERRFEIEFLDAGAEAYCFTFG